MVHWKNLKASRPKSPGNNASRNICCTSDPEIATQSTIKNLLKSIDEGRPKNPMEFDDCDVHGRAGETYCVPEGHVTVLCETSGEVCYYQGGLSFIIRRQGFNRLVGRRSSHGMASSDPRAGTRRLSIIEVEFILGVLSAMDPLFSWTVLGNDLLEFADRNKRNLSRWTAKIVSLLLAQVLLKTFTSKLYKRLSSIIVDGIWSEASETVPTDDAYVARLTGYLIGSYKSEEFMERTLDARCSIFFYSLQALEDLVEIAAMGLGEEDEMGARKDRLRHLLQRMGAQVSASDIGSYLEEAEQHPGEIKKAVQLLWSAFDQV